MVMKLKYITAVLLISFIITATGTLHAQVINGLVAKYSFNDGNANDDVANHNGVVTGATLTTDRFGCKNNAYKFIGANSDKITIANNDTINFTNTQSFSVALWMRIGSANTVHSYPLAKHIPGTWNGYVFLSNNTDLGYCNGTGKFSYYTASASQQDACANNLISNDTSHWIFIVGIYKGNLNRSYLYVDGVKQTDTGKATGSISNTSNLFFGGCPGLGYYSGKVDDIRIYNRAISQSEIDSLFNEPAPNCNSLNDEGGLINNDLISIYPVPASDMLNVNKENNLTATIEVIDLAGRTLFKENVNVKVTQINLQLFASGVYLLKYNDGKNQQVKKFVVER